MTSFLTALRQQGNIFFALLSREEEHRRRAPMESILAMAEPLLLIGAIGTLWYYVGTHNRAPIGNSTILYYSTGLLPLYMFIRITSRSMKGWNISSRRYPIERRLDSYIVAILFRVFDYVVVGAVFFSALYALNVSDARPYNYGAIFQAITAISMLGFGWGVLISTVTQIFPMWTYVNMVVARCLIFISGIFFVPDLLPPNVRYVLSFNPMLQAIELFKNGFYPNYALLTLDRAYLAGCAIFAVVIGLTLERVTRRLEVKPRRIRR